jgi:hypothetical protein
VSVYDPEAFEERVQYAANIIGQGSYGGRCFDTCFEMCDGDYVMAALVRRVLKNPHTYLATNLFRFIDRGRAMEHYERTKHLSPRELRAAALKAALR